MPTSRPAVRRFAPWPGPTPSGSGRRRSVIVLARLLALLVVAAGSGASIAAQDDGTAALPPITLDALDEARWSVTAIVAAPGQVIRVTNRGAQPHTFAVREWGIDVSLPTLEPVDITVPATARPGEVVTFYCSEPGHRELGQEGTITIVDAETAQELARDAERSGAEGERVVIETSDAFAWVPNAVEAAPGQIIEVRNVGVLEHHFVVDEWGVNETISAGEVKLIPVPDTVSPGQSFVFYCSVPGHRPSGMEGTLTIVEGQGGRTSSVPDPPQGPAAGADVDRFVPQPSIFGPGWSEVRTGNARAVVPDFDTVSSRIFPGEGRGATYIGPAGSRSTVVVLPFSATNAPANQIEDAILAVQVAMMQEWDTDLTGNEALARIAPPPGCDRADRASGITRVYTLPAGSTVCQLRSAQVAIFVTIEGQLGGATGVEAADQIITRLLRAA